MILAGASAAWADNLPPVPKVVSVPISAVIVPKAESAPEPAKAETAEPKAEARFILTEKEAPLPHRLCQATLCLMPSAAQCPVSANAAGSQD